LNTPKLKSLVVNGNQLEEVSEFIAEKTFDLEKLEVYSERGDLSFLLSMNLTTYSQETSVSFYWKLTLDSDLALQIPSTNSLDIVIGDRYEVTMVTIKNAKDETTGFEIEWREDFSDVASKFLYAGFEKARVYFEILDKNNQRKLTIRAKSLSCLKNE
jgi:hypothetical protein